MRRTSRRNRVRLSLEELESRLTPSLVAAYNFDEGSGTLLTDRSGNGNTGTIQNATWVAGKYGTALKFTGAANSLVNVPDAASLQLTNGMTIEAWVNVSTLSSLDSGWIAGVAKEYRQAGNDIEYGLYVASGTNTGPGGHVYINGKDTAATGTTKVALNTWTFLTTTYDGATLRTYVNGTQVASKALTGNIAVTTDPLRLGGDWSSEMMTGLLDEVRIYNTALTQSQIQTDMNTPVDSVPPTVSMTAPVAGSTVSGTSVTVSANATDNVGVAKVQFLLDGANLRSPVTAAPYQISWNSTSAQDGPHTLAAKATDTAGNSTTSTAITVNVSNPDVTPPSVSITAPSAGSTLVGTVSLTASANDNRGVASVQFQIDNTNLGAPVTSAPYSIPWDTTTVMTGSHTITAIATDTSGNTASTSITVTVNQDFDGIPPTVGITTPANGATVAGTITVSATATDNVTVASVQFILDNVNYGSSLIVAPYSFSWDTSTVANGNHTWKAVAQDAWGNATTSSSVTVTVNNDTIPPSVNITAPTAGSTLVGTVTLTANASDNRGVAGVQFQIDGSNVGAPLTSAPYSEPWDTTTVANGSHTITGIATDTSGNSASTSITVTVNQDFDGIPPTVAITAPASGSTVVGSITVSAMATDNVAVSSVQFVLDNVNYGAPLTAAPYSFSWNSTTVANGNHTWKAIALDPSGNSATSSTVTVTVNNDTIPPTVSITAPNAGSTLAGTVTLTASASDNKGVAGVQFQIDGINYGPPITTAPYSEPWDTTTATTGTHTITAIATDTSGNTASANIKVTVNQNIDTTLPTVAITAPANNGNYAGTLTLSANASDNVAVASVQFFVDSTSVGSPTTTAPYQVTWDSSKVADGTHTITAKATDTSGNTATSSVTVRIVNGGLFSSVINFPTNPYDGSPLVAVNMVLLDTGKILMWDGGPDCIGALSPTVWDPVAGTFTPVPLETQPELRDIFCSAQTVLPDGRVLVVGGHDCTSTTFIGTAIANVFDPATNQWAFLPNMNDRRWYPTATTLPDGRALVTAGSATGTIDYDPISEVYDSATNTWTKLTGANQVIPNYPFMFVLPDGRVLAAGSDEAQMASYVLNVATQTWSVVDPTVLDAGSAVQYLPGKIMKTGSSYLSPPPDNGGGVPSKATTYVIDMNQPSPTWQQTAPMANARTHLNLTILPDDTVLATGGSSDIGGVNPANAVYPAELWSPITQTWTTMASMVTPRLYHSTALLLPDGRVAVAGGGRNYFNNIAYPSSEIYSPAYLFKGPRPTITSAPTTLSFGSNFFVGTPDGASIASVALIRNGSVTHSFNMDQTYVPLSFTQTSGGLTVQAPADADLAPPGYYMLFIINSNGVPSIAPFVQVPASSADSQPPTAPDNLTTAGAIGSITLNWTASTDNVAVVGYDIYRSTTSGFTPSSANHIGSSTTTTFTDHVAAGTYYYLVTARDAAGNSSAPSNEASGTALSDTTAPTVLITSPAGGSIVSGAVTLTATASDNVAVASVQFQIDGQNLGTPITTAPYTTTWNSNSYANGSHTITAIASDVSGNVASASVTVILNNTNLVAAYNFDEGSGTSLIDRSGNSNNGTIQNATWVAGKYGTSLRFTGAANSLVNVPDAASLHLTNGMTIEAWVNVSTLSSLDSGWIAAVAKEYHQAGNDIEYGLYVASGTNTGPGGHVYINGKDTAATGATKVALNTWTFLTTTYDGATLRTYVNGTQVASKALTGNIAVTTDPLRLGGDLSSEMMTGLLDNVRIYNVALSQAAIQADMNTAISVGGSPLVAAPNTVLPTGSSQPVTADATSELLSGDRYVFVNDPQGLFTTDEQDRIIDAITSMDVTLAPYHITMTQVDAAHYSLANIIIDTSNTSAGGGVAQGVLGFTTKSGEITLIQGWDWYAGGNPEGIAANQYDFQTVVTHELGHALGLGHNSDPTSVMYAVLMPGTAKRDLKESDLYFLDTNQDSDALEAVTMDLTTRQHNHADVVTDFSTPGSIALDMTTKGSLASSSLPLEQLSRLPRQINGSPLSLPAPRVLILSSDGATGTGPGFEQEFVAHLQSENGPDSITDLHWSSSTSMNSLQDFELNRNSATPFSSSDAGFTIGNGLYIVEVSREPEDGLNLDFFTRATRKGAILDRLALADVDGVFAGKFLPRDDDAISCLGE